MRRFALPLALLAGAALAAPAAAQRTTERFIPAGASPGVSGISAYMAPVSAVNASARTLTFAGPEGPMTIQLSDTTRVWLDRSRQGLPTVAGTLADVRAGWTVEVKFADPARRQGAVWIKAVVPTDRPARR